MGVVYQAKCLITGKSYIGYTHQKFKSRRKAHKEAAFDPTSRSGAEAPFYEAIREHGWTTFQWSVLFTSDSVEELLTKELETIERMNTYVPNGYNLDTSRARPVRDVRSGIIYPSIRAASRETNSGHIGIMLSCNTGLPLANGKQFEWVVKEKSENEEKHDETSL